MAKKLKGEKEKKLLLSTKKRIERQEERKQIKEKKMITKRKKAFVGLFKPKKAKISRRAVSRRARGTSKLFTALAGDEKRKGRGRPTGTYKYGMPISEYKKLQSRKRALQQQYQEEQIGKLRRRGISPEQLRQMQLVRTMEEGTGPPQEMGRKGDVPEQMVDEELAFKKWASKKVLSPSANKILTRLRRVQNKGKADNIRQQRIHEERRIISEKGNLMKAHENMISVSLDFTGVSQENVLMAPNVFKENPEDNILRPKRLNILQSKEAGTNLKF